MKPLTPKQERFCLEYVIDNNATQACIRAGYSKKTAHSSGPRLLDNVGVKARIAELQAETAKKLEITREDTIRKAIEMTELYDELKRLAMLDDPTLEEELKYSRLVAIIKASDSNTAINTILKANGWNAPDKSEVTIKSEQPLFGPIDNDKKNQ